MKRQRFVRRFSTDFCHFRHKATEIFRLLGADAVLVGGGSVHYWLRRN